MSYYKPLTPKLRNDILYSINSQINDLNTCQMNALENLSRALPDGYPIPFERKRCINMTNSERIKNMSDEELAKFIESLWCYGHGWCEKCPSLNGNYCNGMRANKPDGGILEWLKQSVGANK